VVILVENEACNCSKPITRIWSFWVDLLRDRSGS